MWQSALYTSITNMIITKTLKYYIQNIKQNEQNYEEICFKIHDNDKQNIYIIHKAIKIQLLNQRKGNAYTKTRSQVRGGGKKPWKQKGTGRARAGSTRSPLWKGGGVIFGPKTRTYKSKINKKEKQLALKAILCNKYKNTNIIENFAQNLTTPKSKTIINELNQLNISQYTDINNKILIVATKITKNQYLSIRNIPNINLISVYNLNLLSIIKAQYLIITLDALHIIKNKYSI